MSEPLVDIWAVIVSLLVLVAPVVVPFWWVPLVGATVLALRRGVVVLRHRSWSRDARLVEVLPPPTAELAGAEAFWTQMLGLLRPAWKRWVLGQPHVVWEYVVDQTGLRIRLWVPGGVPPHLVERAVEASWPGASATTGQVSSPVEGVRARRRRVLPLVETRVDFALSREELLADDRGASDADLDPAGDAALVMAELENTAVFHGWEEVGIQGITQESPHRHIPPTADIEDSRRRVARAVEMLLTCGVDGPYALAVGSRDYTAVTETAEHGGFPLFDHLRKILGGPIIWTPGVRGGVVLSLRGGDFLFESGQDIAVGYDHHDAREVSFYLEQSFNFRVASPEAAVALAPDDE